MLLLEFFMRSNSVSQVLHIFFFGVPCFPKCFFYILFLVKGSTTMGPSTVPFCWLVGERGRGKSRTNSQGPTRSFLPRFGPRCA